MQDTVGFRVLYVLVIMELASRRIVHLNVTEHPTIEWVKKQVQNACFEEQPKFLATTGGKGSLDVRSKSERQGGEFLAAARSMCGSVGVLRVVILLAYPLRASRHLDLSRSGALELISTESLRTTTRLSSNKTAFMAACRHAKLSGVTPARFEAPFRLTACHGGDGFEDASGTGRLAQH